MIVSVENGDIGYTVNLDGKELKQCYAADDWLGKAWVHKTNLTGDVVIVDDETVSETLTGKVVITKVLGCHSKLDVPEPPPTEVVDQDIHPIRDLKVACKRFFTG